MPSTTARVSSDDLGFAVEWLLSYEGASGSPVAAQDPADDDEQQAVLRRVAAWVQAEADRRNRERRVRQVAASAAAAHGMSPRDPRVLGAARRAVAEHAGGQR